MARNRAQRTAATARPTVQNRSEHRTTQRMYRGTIPARVVAAAGMATTLATGALAAGALAIAVMAPQAAIGRQVVSSPVRLVSNDLESAINDVLAAEQQAATLDSALPYATPENQALLGPFLQGTVAGMLNRQITVDQGSSPLTYPWTAPLADPQQAPNLGNPDTLYDVVHLNPDETVTITVHPGPGTEDFTIQPVVLTLANQGFPTTLPTGALDLANLTPNPDGSYTIVASPTEQAGNWISTVGANSLQIRDTIGEFGVLPDQVSIETSDPTPSLPLLSSSDISSMLENFAANVAPSNAINKNVYALFHKLGDNEFTQVAHTGSGGLAGQDSALGNFHLQPDEALIVKVPEVEAEYSGAQLGNVWFQGLPFETAEGSLNNTQVFPDPDGFTYYVISADDPGVANWLDTSGVADGDVFLRWQGATGALPTVPIQTEVVNVADVRDYLPADTPVVTAAERATELQDRLLSYDYDLHALKDSSWVTNNLELDQVKSALGTAQFNEVFGGQQDVPSVWDRMTDSALMPDVATVDNDLLANPSDSLSAIVQNVPLAIKDIEMPTVLAALRLDEAIATGQGLQGLETVFNEILTDPATSITAGFLDARDDLEVSIMNAASYSALTPGDFTAVADQLSQLNQSMSELLTAGFNLALGSIG